MLERDFVRDTVKPDLQEKFPGCMILKQNANLRQGIPDLLVLWEDKWASLETKRSPKADQQVNQDYYVEKMNGMSFSAFANPDNWDEVLGAIQQAFGVSG